MSQRIAVIVALIALCAAPVLLVRESSSRAGDTILPVELEGLVGPVRVVRDSDNVPHIFARNDHDGYFMIGYLHAQDRLFQMDVSRRLFSGTLAELLGEQVLPQDIQLRTLGLRRAAERSLPAYSPEGRAILQAYADGVNAFLAQGNPLPLEYQLLELTSVAPWNVIDTLAVAKGLAFGLSFDIDDIDRTMALQAYMEAGAAGGFDGQALFSQDVFRSEPLDDTVSIPEATLLEPRSEERGAFSPGDLERRFREALRPETLQLARDYLKKLDGMPALRAMLSASRRGGGSNWWIIAPENSATGNALFANDPHLALNTSPVFYEAHLEVVDDPGQGPANVAGVTFPGAPVFVQGCNETMCWGSTVNPMDVTDVYQESLVVNPATLVPEGTRFGDQVEPVELLGQVFRVNRFPDGENDNVEQIPLSPQEGAFTVVVPRRNNGPIVSFDADLADPDFDPNNVSALSVQYTGWSATREGEAFWRISRARSVKDFREALQYFDVGSQNFGYADINGNIAYFTSAELPLREDLQANAPQGLPPFFIRNGVEPGNEWIAIEGTLPATQSLPFEILPFEEMPQLVNPDRGWIANANNDPIGVSLDNNTLDQLRPGGNGILYLNPGFTSLRMGRIARLIEGILEGGGQLTVDDMAEIQSNNQLLEAEIFTPFILQAFDNAVAGDAPAALAGLGADPDIAQASERLRNWDFSTPTGIQQGYDPGDDPDNLPEPDQAEIDASVAATIYSVWRGQFVRSVLDGTLQRLGLGGFAPSSEVSLAALRHHLDTFDANQGVGASGVDFFAVEEGAGVEDPADRRDFLILSALGDALDLLASDTFAPAFANSPDQDDYRWGRLHRIVFDHPLGNPGDPAPDFNIPTAGGFSNLAPDLPGVARPGGFQAVDASSHSARADGLNEFMFGSGPARRFVGDLDPEGIDGLEILPGGQSGNVLSPDYAGQMGRWLTNQFHPLRLRRDQVAAAAVAEQVFTPPRFLFFFPFLQGDTDQFTAFALANRLDRDVSVEATAWSDQGEALAFPDNPATPDLAAGTQLARLGTEIFGLDPGAEQSGWVQISVDPGEGPAPEQPFLSSFTQIGDFGLQRLDGYSAIPATATRMWLTRIFEGTNSFQRSQDARTFIAVANPNDGDITVRLDLFGPEGAVAPRGLVGPPSAIIRDIPAKGLLFGNVADLFDAPNVSDGYIDIQVTEGSGAAAMELIVLEDSQTNIVLPANLGNGTTLLHSAQFAQIPGSIVTSLKFINTSDFEREVDGLFVNNEGSVFRGLNFSPLPPGGVFENPSLNPDETFVGSVILEADGPGVISDVIFFEPNTGQFAAALQFQSFPFRKATFGHVANVPGVFFTGLALFNIGDEAAQVDIEVFNADGSASGDASLVLEPGRRISNTLAELVEGTEGQTGGFIVVTSTQPLVGQEIFGTPDFVLQSAVPPLIEQ